jgi:hypothetical protein
MLPAVPVSCSPLRSLTWNDVLLLTLNPIGSDTILRVREGHLAGADLGALLAGGEPTPASYALALNDLTKKAASGMSGYYIGHNYTFFLRILALIQTISVQSRTGLTDRLKISRTALSLAALHAW